MRVVEKNNVGLLYELKPEELTEGLRIQTEVKFKNKEIRVWDIATEQYITGIFIGFDMNEYIENTGIKKYVERMYKKSHFKYKAFIYIEKTGCHYELCVMDVIRRYNLHNQFHNRNIPETVIVNTSNPTCKSDKVVR